MTIHYPHLKRGRRGTYYPADLHVLNREGCCTSCGYRTHMSSNCPSCEGKVINEP